MLAQSDPRALIYQVLDDVLIGGSVPPGTSGKVFAAIDTLKASAASGHDLRRAEKISQQIHCLQTYTLRQDRFGMDSARTELRALAADWINSRLMRP